MLKTPPQAAEGTWERLVGYSQRPISARAVERRRCPRVVATGPAILRDCQRRFLARCSVANINAEGVFVVTRATPDLPTAGRVYLEMALPADLDPQGPRRTVVHLCRVVRTQQVGKLIGLGLEFLEKVV